MAVPRLALGEDRSGGDIQRGKQRGSAMADIIVGDSFHITKAHGQHRLGAAERLNLRFLVHRQHDGMIGRVQIQANDVAHLFDEEGIGGELECFTSMRLHRERLEDPAHGGLRDPVGFGGLTDAPVRSRRRLGLQRASKQRGYLLVRQRGRAARTKLVIEALNAALDQSLPPLAHRGLGPLQLRSDLGVGPPFG